MPQDAVKSLGASWGKIPDIVLSDCYGKATDREILDQTENAFKEQGFRVSINQPFSGGFITKHYGDPILNQDAIQIEINRSLYMNELKIEKADSFDDFKKVISKVFKKLAYIGRESMQVSSRVKLSKRTTSQNRFVSKLLSYFIGSFFHIHTISCFEID